MRISDWSSDVCSSDLDYRRAETGESETGKLLYAGLIRGGKPKLSMLEWNADGRAQWFDASGVGEQRGGMTRPTRGRVTKSEEHTSELQSLMRLSYAVFCLKKKKIT